MQATNTRHSYGWVSKTFHWAIALMILAMFALGWSASILADRLTAPGITATDATATWARLLFSMHKTLGVMILFLAILRILWALSQPRPGLLNGDNRPEAALAETVHWLIYGSLVLVPLSGWVHHAATTGFAPIWWPLGQDLPLVPKDTQFAEASGAVHFILQWVLAAALTLHILGAFKHHLIDRDATLSRMLPGHTQAQPTKAQPGHALPIIAALVLWGAALGVGALAGWLSPSTPARGEALAGVQGNWAVQDGALSITITQNGQEVTGHFANWSADITYSETADSNARHGYVTVTVAIPSLSLGSVTEMALNPEYLAAQEWPTATFEADLVQRDGGLHGVGSLRIRDHELPVKMPVMLRTDGNTAHASGKLAVDRRDFGVGTGTKDEATLAFPVAIDWQLTAKRAARD